MGKTVANLTRFKETLPTKFNGVKLKHTPSFSTPSRFIKAEGQTADRLLIRPELARIFYFLQLPAGLALSLWKRAQRFGFYRIPFDGIRLIRQFNYIEFWKILSVLTLPNVRPALIRYPRNCYKYFGNYLSLSFSTEFRARALAYHYNYLDSHFNNCFMDRIMNGQILIWEEIKNDCHFSIRLGYPHDGTDSEGDLSLIFYSDDLLLYTINFSIVPGEIFNLSSYPVIFVGRIQGSRGCFEYIKHATKSFEELPPSTLLITAAQALSKVLGITTMVGVRNNDQICVGIGDNSSLSDTCQAYDKLWISLGSQRLNDKLNILTFGGEKPLNMIRNHHRSRVKRQRHLKSEFINTMGGTFKANCLD